MIKILVVFILLIPSLVWRTTVEDDEIYWGVHVQGTGDNTTLKLWKSATQIIGFGKTGNNASAIRFDLFLGGVE